jgi:cytochrome c oxidase assembly factor CtaG
MSISHQRSISRRSMMQRAAITAGAEAMAVFSARIAAAEAPAATKVSKDSAGYQATPKNGQRCGECLQWQPPNGCTVVEGNVSPAGWCKLFASKNA